MAQSNYRLDDDLSHIFSDIDTHFDDLDSDFDEIVSESHSSRKSRRRDVDIKWSEDELDWSDEITPPAQDTTTGRAFETEDEYMDNESTDDLDTEEEYKDDAQEAKEKKKKKKKKEKEKNNKKKKESAQLGDDLFSDMEDETHSPRRKRRPLIGTYKKRENVAEDIENMDANNLIFNPSEDEEEEEEEVYYRVKPAPKKVARRQRRDITKEKKKPRISNKFNPFLLFNRKVRLEIIRDNPGMTNGEVSQMVAKMWKELDPVEKEKYIAEGAENKAQIKAMTAKLAPIIPKPPTNGYVLYSNELFPKLRAENPDIKNILELNQTVSGRWKALSQEERDRYTEEARKQRDKYQEEFPELVNSKKRAMYSKAKATKQANLKKKKDSAMNENK
ncbi:high mobility group box-domain-containing protein [Pilobolus umbonatus]|nr:high mobility group box-domain-containing protein [Pilobolus umbonatus]